MIKIALKDLKLFFADGKGVFLTYLLPIFLITIFVFAFGGNKSTKSSPRTMKVLLSDLDSSKSSMSLVNDLKTINGLELIPTEKQKAIDLIKQGKYASGLYIKKGYETTLQKHGSLSLELFVDSGREIEMGILQQALYSKLGNALQGNDWVSVAADQIDEQFPELSSEMKESILTKIESGFNDSGNPTNSDAKELIKVTKIVGDPKTNLALVQAVAGTAVMMLLFSVAASGAGILEEKETGTLRKLMLSPINPYAILAGKSLATLIISISQLVILFLFAGIVFGLNLFQNIPALLTMILVTAIACTSFGVFLASICNSRKQLESLSTIIILLMSALGGSMMPIFFMPDFMQSIAVVSINYWAIQGFFDIFWRELSFSYLLENIGILLGISAVVIAISTVFFKKNILSIS